MVILMVIIFFGNATGKLITIKVRETLWEERHEYLHIFLPREQVGVLVLSETAGRMFQEAHPAFCALPV